MARQRLGFKKHKRCEEIGGREYTACLVTGGTHDWAICVYPEDHSRADLVNYRTGEIKRGGGED